jgi:hypothetical protein
VIRLNTFARFTTASVFCALAASWSSALHAEQFSIKCVHELRHMDFYFTFDSETKRVIYETLALLHMPGELVSMDPDMVEFWIIGKPRFDIVWNRRDGIVTVKGVPGNDSRPTVVSPCVETALRPAAKSFDDYWPR